MAPIGESLFSLSATDGHLVTDVASTTVRVSDSVAPSLNIEVAPNCLWPPNHKMVLFDLGANVRTAIYDSCDPAPLVQVVGVTSDEPEDMTGSGSTAPDYTWSSSGFCLRAERSGTGAGRTYRVSVRATDASGNSSTTMVPITVPHDLGQGVCRQGRGLAVEDDDPRCRSVSATGGQQSPASVAAHTPPPAGAPAAGCSSSGDSASMLLLSLAFLGFARRCSRPTASTAMLAALLLQSCASPATNTGTVPYEECIRGWWIDAEATSGCACPEQAECSFADCAGFTFVGVMADATWHSGSLSISAEGRSFSTQATVSRATFNVVGTNLLELTAGTSTRKVSVQCGAQAGLVLNGVKKVRMDTSMADRIAAELGQGHQSWAALSF